MNRSFSKIKKGVVSALVLFLGITSLIFTPVLAKDIILPTPSDTANVTNPAIVNLINSNKLIEGKEFGGQYGFYITAKDKNGKSYVSNFTSMSALNVDNIDYNSIVGHFVVNNGSDSTPIAMILTLPNYSSGGKSTLVVDESRIDKLAGLHVKSQSDTNYDNLITYSKKAGEYLDWNTFKKTYGENAIDKELKAIYLQRGNINANDKIEVEVPLTLTKNPSEVGVRSEMFQIMNFTKGHNGYATNDATVRLSHGNDLDESFVAYPKIVPAYLTKTGVDGGSEWIYDESIQDLFPTADKAMRFQSISNQGNPEESVNYKINDKGLYELTPIERYSNMLPVYYLDFMNNGIQEKLTKHGYTVNPIRIPAGSYAYRMQSEPVSIEGFDRPNYDNTKYRVLHFQVIPAILLKPDKHLIAKNSETEEFFDTSSMVRQFTDPRKTRYVLDENDPELATASLDKSLLNVAITDITNPKEEKSVQKISLNKPGSYKVVYSYNYDGLEISNTGYVYIKADDQNVQLRVIDEKTNKEIANPDESIQTSFWGKSNGKVDKEAIQKSVDQILEKLDKAGYVKAKDIIIPDKFDNSENYESDKDSNVQYIDIYVKGKEKPSDKPENIIDKPGKDAGKSANEKTKVKETPKTGDSGINVYLELGIAFTAILVLIIFVRIKKKKA